MIARSSDPHAGDSVCLAAKSRHSQRPEASTMWLGMHSGTWHPAVGVRVQCIECRHTSAPSTAPLDLTAERDQLHIGNKVMVQGKGAGTVIALPDQTIPLYTVMEERNGHIVTATAAQLHVLWEDIIAEPVEENKRNPSTRPTNMPSFRPTFPKSRVTALSFSKRARSSIDHKDTSSKYPTDPLLLSTASPTTPQLAKAHRKAMPTVQPTVLATVSLEINEQTEKRCQLSHAALVRCITLGGCACRRSVCLFSC